ncbi:hypothetical protein GGQ22_09720 [Nocardioides sp. zg-579]|uniref:MarR family transcriptional regulator n=1 Tax=Nocardioides marmotae TaxID=2663857 RepID=A0A6I3JB58_9ACTN|nr:hypothetical protein [Nocardioides marmotae]MCR6031723.1 hypothetical protein [Gordonia jinghuaiqii]MTB95362.1 hypothetical protein [Nocardioides marmotae]QKE02180.1 hypothetical protein HPC71_14670 [Nocardioides marmotae]
MDRVEDLLHEALSEYAVQGDAYLARVAERMSPGMGRLALVVLIRVDRFGALREADLIAQLRLPAAETRRLVDDLVTRGLAARTGGEAPMLVGLTERARGLLLDAADERRGRILDSLEDFTLEEKEIFARLLAKFVQRDDLVVRSLDLPQRG